MKKKTSGLCLLLSVVLGLNFSLCGAITTKAEEVYESKAIDTEMVEEMIEYEDTEEEEAVSELENAEIEEIIPESEISSTEEELREVGSTGTETAEERESEFDGSAEVKGANISGFWQYSINWDNEVTIEKYTGAEVSVSVPSTIAGKTVKYLGGSAFKDNTWTVSVNVPDTVTSIEYSCFSGCTSLSTVSGMANVAYLGGYAFYNCSSLTSVSFGTSLESIGDHAFKNCVKLTKCEFPASLTTLQEWCFENTGLTSVSILRSDVKLDSGVFYNCQDLISAQINSYVSASAFRNCLKLKTISIGANVGIGNQAFDGCSALNNVTITEGSNGINIRENAFRACTSLGNVSLPKNVRYVYESAFEGCTSLNNVNLPFGLLEIKNYAFYNTPALNSVVIPNSVRTIGYRAFDNGSLSSIVIPNSVTSINDLCSNTAVIRCYPGSYAESYAREKNHPIELLQSVASTSIAFSTSTIYMNADDVKKLSYTITPANTTDAIVWESSSDRIAAVNGVGEVTAKDAGSATIIATTTSGKRATVNVVVANRPNSISFSKSSVTIMVGESVTQAAVVKDNAGVRKDIVPSYSSSNSGIATVSATGTVTGIKEGTVTIKAKTGSLSATYKVTVVSNQPKGISFKRSKKTVLVGKTVKQKAVVQGSAGVLKQAVPSYTSSNTKIATVSSTGAVKGLKPGTVTIKAKIGSYTATYKVEVVMAKISKKGKTLTIKTIPKARVKVSAKKSILGSSSKAKKANKKGVVKIKFKKPIKRVTVKVKISKSGYKKTTIKKNY